MKTYAAVVVVDGIRIDVTVQAKGAAQAKAMIEAQYGKGSIKIHPMVVR